MGEDIARRDKKDAADGRMNQSWLSYVMGAYNAFVRHQQNGLISSAHWIFTHTATPNAHSFRSLFTDILDF